jgi:hypothetical protein
MILPEVLALTPFADERVERAMRRHSARSADLEMAALSRWLREGYPSVAHIVADLDELEAAEIDMSDGTGERRPSGTIPVAASANPSSTRGLSPRHG